MSGIRHLPTLLAQMQPRLDSGVWVVCQQPLDAALIERQPPFALVREQEGWTWVVAQAQADARGWGYEGCFSLISLEVHSSLQAVGLTAAFAACLADEGISANVLAGYYHDHLLVPQHQADQAMLALQALANAHTDSQRLR